MERLNLIWKLVKKLSLNIYFSNFNLNEDFFLIYLMKIKSMQSLIVMIL